MIKNELKNGNWLHKRCFHASGNFFCICSKHIEKKAEKKESPLYKIRTNRAIKEKIKNIITNYLENRISLNPFQRIKNRGDYNIREQIRFKCEVQGLTESYGNSCITSMSDLESCNIWLCPRTWE